MVGGVVSCADGQPFCDADGTMDGRCTFHLAVCLNSTDPRLTCTPTSIDAVALAPKLARSTDPTDQANATALLTALRSVDPESTGTVSASGVTYTPPAATQNACSSYVDVVVPVKSHGTSVVAGTRQLQVWTQTAAGKLGATLTLVCNPVFP